MEKKISILTSGWLPIWVVWNRALVSVLSLVLFAPWTVVEMGTFDLSLKNNQQDQLLSL